MSENKPSTLQLLTPREAAKELGVSPRTLAIWRCRNRYPLRYTKIGYRVFYQMKHIVAFVELRTHDGNTPIGRTRRKR